MSICHYVIRDRQKSRIKCVNYSNYYNYPVRLKKQDGSLGFTFATP